MVFFSFSKNNKTVKELRKNQGYTARELALREKLMPVKSWLWII
jgi:hypothetical protein